MGTLRFAHPTKLTSAASYRAPSRSRADPATPSACRTASAADRPDGRSPSRGWCGCRCRSRTIAARPHDALAGRQQRLRRGIAERHQHVRVHQFDLALDERQADLRLLRRRRAVAGRPPRNDVGDVGLAAVEPDRGDHPVEQLAGAADKRQALDVLVAARRLADEHDARLRIAVGEYQPRRGVFQRAAVEIFQQRAQRLQRRRGARRFARDAIAASGAGAISLRGTAGVAAGVSRNGRGGAVSRAGTEAMGASGSASRLTGSSASAQSTPASR